MPGGGRALLQGWDAVRRECPFALTIASLETEGIETNHLDIRLSWDAAQHAEMCRQIWRREIPTVDRVLSSLPTPLRRDEASWGAQ